MINKVQSCLLLLLLLLFRKQFLSSLLLASLEENVGPWHPLAAVWLLLVSLRIVQLVHWKVLLIPELLRGSCHVRLSFSVAVIHPPPSTPAVFTATSVWHPPLDMAHLTVASAFQNSCGDFEQLHTQRTYVIGVQATVKFRNLRHIDW